GFGGSGLRSQCRAARRRRARCADHQGSRAASRGEDHRLHRGTRVRLVASSVAERQARLHRGGGRQRDRHRLDRQFSRHVRQHRLLAVALFRPDVHGAQNIFVPGAGVETDEGHKSFDEVAEGVAAAVDRLLAEPARAAAVLGAIQGDATLKRVKEATALGRVVRASTPVEGLARSAGPLILAVDAADEAAYREERFGPISFVIATGSTADSLARAESSIRERGAITAALYTTSEAVADAAE